MAVGFLGFLALFIAIGAYSATRKQNTTVDYLLAGRSVGPWLVALSAVATNNSGFMFVGLIGATYNDGVGAMWIMFGWVVGDWMAWFFVHRRLREQSEQINVSTIPAFLSHGLGPGTRLVSVVAGLIILVFLGLYAAAQLNAGGVATMHVFGWQDARLAAVLGAVVVAGYCFAGGIRASIWTDAAQSMLMIASMVALFVYAVAQAGGLGGLWASLEAIDPKLIVIAPGDYKLGFIGYFFGWMGAGAGVIGQPHVMVRAMAIDSPDNIAKARRIYVVWYLLFSAACIGVGLAARVLLPELGDQAEHALPLLSKNLFPSFAVGMILAGLFAATMSTADSQVLSCSAAVTQDIFPRLGGSYAAVKLATLGVTGLALVMALFGESLGVFELVKIAWSMLAAGLGPLLLIRVMRWPISAGSATAVMLIGIAGSLLWRFGLALGGDVYEALPGMLAGLAAYGLLRLVNAIRSKTPDVS